MTTQPPQPKFGAGPSGFIADQGGPPPANVPQKIGFRRRVKPQCQLELDAWCLTPQTLGQIALELRQRARIAERKRDRTDRAALTEAADTLEGFLDQRRMYGEGWNPWG